MLALPPRAASSCGAPRVALCSSPRNDGRRQRRVTHRRRSAGRSWIVDGHRLALGNFGHWRQGRGRRRGRRRNFGALRQECCHRNLRSSVGWVEPAGRARSRCKARAAFAMGRENPGSRLVNCRRVAPDRGSARQKLPQVMPDTVRYSRAAEARTAASPGWVSGQRSANAVARRLRSDSPRVHAMHPALLAVSVFSKGPSHDISRAANNTATTARRYAATATCGPPAATVVAGFRAGSPRGDGP